jgi:hypothetical protein
VKNNYSECLMSLMFFQDKVARNNHLFSCEKGSQLDSRSRGRIQCLTITAHSFWVKFTLHVRELSKIVASINSDFKMSITRKSANKIK